MVTSLSCFLARVRQSLDILLSVTPAELLTVSMLSQSLFPLTISMRRPQLNFEPRSIVYFSEALGDQHRVLTDRSTGAGVMIWTLFPLSTPNVAYEIRNALKGFSKVLRCIFTTDISLDFKNPNLRYLANIVIWCWISLRVTDEVFTDDFAPLHRQLKETNKIGPIDRLFETYTAMFMV